MLQRAISSLAYRAKWARLGVVYGKTLKLNRVTICGRRIELNFPASERPVQEHEFGKIIFEDCYRLSDLPTAKTVLDIGANIGLFALAARRAFPKATVHCYEPNPELMPYLTSHCAQVDCTHFQSAVGFKDGTISLQSSDDGTLHSVARADSSGLISQIAFAKAVDRLGSVDLLKLDCEGAEWEIFEDRETWKQVRHLTMEYHLWAKPGSTVQTLKQALSCLGFDRIQIQNDGSQWGMAFASRS